MALSLKKVEGDNLDFSHLNAPASSFSQVSLSGCHFVGTNIAGSDLIGSQFKSCDFVGSDLSGANMTRAALSHCSFSYSDLRRSWMVEAHFKEVDFMGAMLCGAVVWNAEFAGAKHLKKKNFKDPESSPRNIKTYLSETNAETAFESYRLIKHHFYEKGLHEDASWAAYRELTMERKHFFKTRNPRYIPSLLMNLLSGYTEKPSRVIISSLAIILLFGLVYFLFNVPAPSVAETAGRINLWDSIYFSFITFTTVGYGDFAPRAVLWFRGLACVEAFSGPFMAGLYIFTLTRRYAAG